MPFSAAKPADTSDASIDGQSARETTQQMRAILENSRLEESILSATGWGSRTNVKSRTDPTQQSGHDPASVRRNGPRSKFDELYQEALRNAESILSDSGNLPDGHVMLSNLHSPVHPVDHAPSSKDFRLDSSAAVQSDLHLVKSRDKSLGSTKSGPNCYLSANNANNSASTQDAAGKLSAEFVHVQHSHQSEDKRPSTTDGPLDVNKSMDSSRVAETEISGEYTTEEDDDAEEMRLGSQ